MKKNRVLVCSTQVPFSRGGAEMLVERLVQSLKHEEFETDVLALPFQDYPHEALIRSALIWRMLDVDKLHVRPDAVIATKFPSYFIPHPNKIVWLFHNYRQIYDLHDTPFGGYSRKRSDDLQVVQWISARDREFLMECRKILTISGNVRNRLRKFLDIDAEVFYPPPPLQEKFYCSDYEPFIFVAQRLDRHKRTDLLIRSLEILDGDFKVVIVGTGSEEMRLRDYVSEKGLQSRVDFVGSVTNEQLLEYYARCRMVFYAPYDEDYGFTTLEAFWARKPVLTATDSGGTLEFVEHKVNGWIAKPDPASIASGIQEIMEQVNLASRMGEEGYKKIRCLNWKDTGSRFAEILRDQNL